MSPATQALIDAIAAAERLPLKLQRHLAEQLLAKAARKQTTVTVRLQRLPHEQQTRLAELMDKCNEGKLSSTEQTELTGLGSEVNELMLANSIALARALRPELFDTKVVLLRVVFDKRLDGRRPKMYIPIGRSHTDDFERHSTFGRIEFRKQTPILKRGGHR